MRFTSLLPIALAALPFAVQGAPLKRRQLADTDALVLKFAQVLEQLETEFYKQALAKFTEADFTAAGFAVPAVPIQLFTSILEHEDAHTSFLSAALAAANDAALDTCTFNFDSVLTDVATMAPVARLVEQVGVGAYLGGAALITDKSILAAAASILTIEARHQSALNVLNGGSAIPQAFDQPLTPEQVLSLAGPFISGCDLGIVPNAPVTITNSPVPGEKLEFDLTGLEGDLTCQMILAGHPTALVQPIDNCVVPQGLPDGPVHIFITNEAQPLASNILVQNALQIAAGPAIIFLDQKVDALSDLVRNAEGARDIIDGAAPAPVQTDALGSNSDFKVVGLTTDGSKSA